MLVNFRNNISLFPPLREDTDRCRSNRQVGPRSLISLPVYEHFSKLYLTGKINCLKECGVCNLCHKIDMLLGHHVQHIITSLNCVCLVQSWTTLPMNRSRWNGIVEQARAHQPIKGCRASQEEGEVQELSKIHLARTLSSSSVHCLT
jgi:hypothetical protein